MAKSVEELLSEVKAFCAEGNEESALGAIYDTVDTWMSTESTLYLLLLLLEVGMATDDYPTDVLLGFVGAVIPISHKLGNWTTFLPLVKKTLTKRYGTEEAGEILGHLMEA